MNRRRNADRPAPDFGSAMTPMIDVVFLLLVFFVWTYSSHAIELLLPSRLASPPTGGTAVAETIPRPEQDFEDVIVRVTWDGQQPRWTLNATPVSSLAELQAQLQRIYDVLAETRVIIDPEPTVPVGHVIRVFDLTRLVGFAQVSLAAHRGSR